MAESSLLMSDRYQIFAFSNQGNLIQAIFWRNCVFVSVFLVLTTKKGYFVSTTRKIFEVVLNYDIKLPEKERHKDGEAEEEVGGGGVSTY